VPPSQLQLFPDDTKQVLHDEHEVIRVARARLEIEMLIEAFGVIVLGVNEQDTRANSVGGTRCTQQRILE
jgi:hypothetical protein